MWHFITEHPVLFIVLGVILVLFFLLVFLPELQERMTREWAYTEIETEIKNAQSYSDLKRVEASMIVFKKTFCNTVRGTDLWVKMNKLWEEKEKSIIPSIGIYKRLMYN